MRARLFLFLLLAIGFLAAGATAQTKDPTTAPDPGQNVIQQIDQAEGEWLEHLEKTPEIVVFQGPGKEKAETREDGWRLHTLELREKARSNRAWNEYWKQQGRLGQTLIDRLDQAIEKAASSELLTGQKARLENRRKGMATWVALTKDKMTNQDAFLRAIDSEKDAYESRLDAAVLAKAAADSDIDPPETKEASGGAALEPSAYQRHKRTLRVLTRQRNVQSAKEVEAKNDSAFSAKLMEATTIMLQAEKADVDLAMREHGIAVDQVAGAKSDATWKNRWASIEQRVAGKIERLREVLAVQQESVARLEAEKAYFDALVQIKRDRAADIEKQIETEKKKLPKALLLTARDMALGKGLIVIAYLIGAYLAMIVIRKIGRAIVARAADDNPDSQTDQEQRAETLVAVFSSLGRFAVYIVTFLLLMQALGMNIGPLMGAFAIFGLAISFGSQNLVKDLVNGFFMLLENQLSVGDVVTISGVSGTVEIISLRRIVLRDVQGAIHSIPNSQVNTVCNKTHAWARAVVHVGVGYGDDLRKVREVFERMGQVMYEDPDWKDKLLEPPAFVGVTELGDSAVVVRVWAKTIPHEQWGVERELNLRLKEAADANGIEIPFPQRVVEVKRSEQV